MERGNGNVRLDQIFVNARPRGYAPTRRGTQFDRKHSMFGSEIELWVTTVRDEQNTNNIKKDVPAVSKFASNKILIAHP